MRKPIENGFGFEMHAALMQHLKSIACAVADGENHMIRGDVSPPAKRYAAYLSVVDSDVRDPALKTDFTAERVYRRAQVFNHANQPERADMRLAYVQDFRGCAGLDEFRQAPCARGGADP